MTTPAMIMRAMITRADDRGGERYFEPARGRAAPAAHERFEFPELGGPAPGRMPHGPSAYPGETYPTVPDQHYPAEPELAYRQDEHYPNPGNARLEAPREDLRQDAAYPQGGEYERQYADAEGNRYDEYEYADGEEGAYEDDEPGGKRRNAIKIGARGFGSRRIWKRRGIRLSHGVRWRHRWAAAADPGGHFAHQGDGDGLRRWQCEADQ